MTIDLILRRPQSGPRRMQAEAQPKSGLPDFGMLVFKSAKADLNASPFEARAMRGHLRVR